MTTTTTSIIALPNTQKTLPNAEKTYYTNKFRANKNMEKSFHARNNKNNNNNNGQYKKRSLKFRIHVGQTVDKFDYGKCIYSESFFVTFAKANNNNNKMYQYNKRETIQLFGSTLIFPLSCEGIILEQI